MARRPGPVVRGNSETAGLPSGFYRIQVDAVPGIPDIDELSRLFAGGFSQVFVRPMLWKQHSARSVMTQARTAVVMVRDFHDPSEAPTLVEYHLSDAVEWGLENGVLRLLPANEAELYGLSRCRAAVGDYGGSQLVAPGAETYDLALKGRVAPMLDLSSPERPVLGSHPVSRVFTAGMHIVYAVEGGEAAMRAANARL